jgi:hypothetical protein
MDEAFAFRRDVAGKQEHQTAKRVDFVFVG